MDRELALRLLSGRRARKASTGPKVIVRTTQGVEVQRRTKEHETGYFDAKTGSTKRSRKGRTYKAPNGYVRYNAQDWSESPTVIAYKV